MRNRTNLSGTAAAFATLALALTGTCVLTEIAAAAPRQVGAGMVTTEDVESMGQAKPRGITAAGADEEAQELASRAPRKPDTPADPSIWAPPLPGYALMFILGGAIVALNLWSSKRVRAD